MSDLVTTADEAALQRHPFLRGGDLLAAGAGGTIATTAAGTTPARAHDSQVLAVSFGLYGMLRRIVPVSGMVGLTAETLLLLPWAVLWLGILEKRGELAFGHGGPLLTVLLGSAGWITALPLIWFTEGAKRLRYATLGFLLYLAPTFQFLLAVVAFGEPFTRQHAVSFGFIWAALALYSFDTWQGLRPRNPARASA